MVRLVGDIHPQQVVFLLVTHLSPPVGGTRVQGAGGCGP